MGIALTAQDGKTKMEAVLLSASGSQEELTCGELEIPWAQLRRSREHGEDMLQKATSGHTAQSREKEREIPWHLLLLPLPPIDWTLLKM